MRHLKSTLSIYCLPSCTPILIIELSSYEYHVVDLMKYGQNSLRYVCVCAVLKTCPNLDDVCAFRWFMVFFRKKWPQLYTYASIPTTSGGVQKKSWQPGKKQDLHIVYIHNVKSSLGFMIWFWKKMICKINLFLICSCSIWKKSTKTKLDFI